MILSVLNTLPALLLLTALGSIGIASAQAGCSTHTNNSINASGRAIHDSIYQTQAMRLAFSVVDNMLSSVFEQQSISRDIRSGLLNPRSTVEMFHTLNRIQKQFQEDAQYSYFSFIMAANKNGDLLGFYPSGTSFRAIGAPETVYNTADPRLYGQYNQDTITPHMHHGFVPPAGTTCDPETRCDWPTWHNCSNAICNSTNCCLDRLLYVEYAPAETGATIPSGQVTWVQQWDHRARPMYWNSVIKCGLSNKCEGFSDVDHSPYFEAGVMVLKLTLSAYIGILGDSGSDGSNATSGTYQGGWFAGADFSSAPEELILAVDGEEIHVLLNTDLSDLDVALSAINTGLGGVATATENGHGGITITSSATGATSHVRIQAATGQTIHTKILGTGINTTAPGDVYLGVPPTAVDREIYGTDATAGTYVGERLPHDRTTTDPLTWSSRDSHMPAGHPCENGCPWDFSSNGLGAQNLVLDIDGTSHTIVLETDLANPLNLVNQLNNALTGAATARLITDGFSHGNIVIESTSIGSNSRVAVNPSSSEHARMLVAQPQEVLITFTYELDQVGDFLHQGFPDAERFVVYVMEKHTGFLIGDSNLEGAGNADGSRKCASAATSDLIRQSAALLENMDEEYLLALLDETHSIEMKPLQMFGTAEDGYDVDWQLVVVQTLECGPGQEPGMMDTRVGCLPCSSNTVSASGRQCIDCPTGLVPSEERTSCDACLPGYRPNEMQTLCIDVDECLTNNGGCDRTATADGPSCVNALGDYRCGSCQIGFVTTLTDGDDGRLNGSICLLPVLEVTTGAGAQATVEPGPLTVALDIPADMNPDVLASQMRHDIAQQLGISPEGVTVSLQEVDGRRRQLSEGDAASSSMEAVIEVLVPGAQASALVRNLQSQLQDPSSELISAISNSSGLTFEPEFFEQALVIEFTCPTGSVISDNRCQRCPTDSYSNEGTLISSGGSLVAHCTGCPLGQTNNAETTGCVCKPDHYPTDGYPECFSDTAMGETDISSFPQHETSLGVAKGCLLLTDSNNLQECIASASSWGEGRVGNPGDLAIMAGWVFVARPDGITTSIFQCRTEEACPGGTINATVRATPCAPGYTGILCGNCEPKHTLKTDGTCNSCGDATYTGYAATAAIIVISYFAIRYVNAWYSYFTLLQEMYHTVKELELKALAKIFVALMQIVGGLAGALRIKFPDAFVTFTSKFVSMFRFDFGDLFSMSFSIGCVSSGTYISGLLFNIFLILAVVTAQHLIYEYQIIAVRSGRKGIPEEEYRSRIKEAFDLFDGDGNGVSIKDLRKVAARIADEDGSDMHVTEEEMKKLFDSANTDHDEIVNSDEFYQAVRHSHGKKWRKLVKRQMEIEIAAATGGRLFLIVFLLYPGLTTKIFQGFDCRDLGQGEMVLAVDYSIDCTSDYYGYIKFIVAPILVLLWPFGLPVFLFWKMYKVRHKIVADDPDPDTLKSYDFALGDYNLEHWYWEVVELFRKLILSGLLGIVGRGTVAQAVSGTLVAMYFFAINYKEQPYKAPGLNKVKVFSEFQIFCILLISTTLQSNKSGARSPGFPNEVIDFDGYGNVLNGIMVACVPVTLYFMCQKNFKDPEQREKSKKDAKRKIHRHHHRRKHKEAKKASMCAPKRARAHGQQMENAKQIEAIGDGGMETVRRQDGDVDPVAAKYPLDVDGSSSEPAVTRFRKHSPIIVPLWRRFKGGEDSTVGLEGGGDPTVVKNAGERMRDADVMDSAGTVSLTDDADAQDFDGFDNPLAMNNRGSKHCGESEVELDV